METTPVLNITIPVFNRPELTQKTLRAARKNTPVSHCLTVVDNGSDAKTRNMLIAMKKQGEIDHLFRLEQNFGVAVAANIGWRLVDAPLYMKLDNDIVIHSPHWFTLLHKHMKKHGKDAVWGGDFHYQLDKENYVKERDGFVGKCHSHVSGGAIIIPKSISDVIGYWCEDYGLYGCEDGDYGVRLNTLSIDQFYFDHKPFMQHLGDDNEEMKKEYHLDKKTIQEKFRLLWDTNKYLFENKHRAPNIPPQFVPASYDGYTLKLKQNFHYNDMWKTLMDLHAVILDRNNISAQSEIKALNRFISTQNKTWDDASKFANDNYNAVKALV